MENSLLEEIRDIHIKTKRKIRTRLHEFYNIWREGSEEDIFIELVYCILTVQAKARNSEEAVKSLLKKNLLWEGNAELISKELNMVRFRNNKARYIVEARNSIAVNGKLSLKSRISRFQSVDNAREWLVSGFRGIGYKEASHFLRNIGKGKNLAILDRHILRNLLSLDIITEIPTSLTKKNYIEIEKKMKRFAKDIHIPMSHLDLVLWYKETGEILK